MSSSFISAMQQQPTRQAYQLRTSTSLGAPIAGEIEIELVVRSICLFHYGIENVAFQHSPIDKKPSKAAPRARPAATQPSPRRSKTASMSDTASRFSGRDDDEGDDVSTILDPSFVRYTPPVFRLVAHPNTTQTKSAKELFTNLPPIERRQRLVSLSEHLQNLVDLEEETRNEFERQLEEATGANDAETREMISANIATSGIKMFFP